MRQVAEYDRGRMAFDWQRFLDARSVPYATRGPSVTRGHVAVRCPFCADDPSEHMSINLEGKGWRCWRNHSHRGRSPVRLVQALLNLSWAQAQQIVGGSVFIPEDFIGRVQGALAPAEIERSTRLVMPGDFKPFNLESPTCRPYVEYLREDRWFTTKQIETMTRRYNLRYCTRGAYRGRIIFPIEYEGELVGWTGRSIWKDAGIRYKTLSADKEKAAEEGYPPARATNTHYLLWWDQLRECDADTIVLVEGPFDAIKLWILGRSIGICSTCFFTAEPSQDQIALLHELLPRFKRRVLLLDRGTFAMSVKVQGMLTGLDIEPRQVPEWLKDPGELRSKSELLDVMY